MNHFQKTKRLLLRYSWAFCLGLWLYKMSWRVLETPYGLLNTVPVHIKHLVSFIFSKNIPMIVLLPWIITSIYEEAWIVFPICQNLFLVTFSVCVCGWGGAIQEDFNWQILQTTAELCETIPALTGSVNSIIRLRQINGNRRYIENIVFFQFL